MSLVVVSGRYTLIEMNNQLVSYTIRDGKHHPDLWFAGLHNMPVEGRPSTRYVVMVSPALAQVLERTARTFGEGEGFRVTPFFHGKYANEQVVKTTSLYISSDAPKSSLNAVKARIGTFMDVLAKTMGLTYSMETPTTNLYTGMSPDYFFLNVKKASPELMKDIYVLCNYNVIREKSTGEIHYIYAKTATPRA